MIRTHEAGSLRAEHLGEEVTLAGWVARRRDHGGVTFIDLRDVSGVVQVVFRGAEATEDSEQSRGAEATEDGEPSRGGEVAERAHALRNEFCVAVTGRVERRPAGNENPELATGDIEVNARTLTVLSEAAPLPLPIDEHVDVGEETRLKYRYLDLRRSGPAHALRVRSEMNRIIRDVMHQHRFVEVETPTLTRSTPEGARDFVVPVRLQPGSWYALPQSPQLFKQLLMVAGVERYFQIARCYRDEDFRADRQPEFTQIDLEASFVSAEDVQNVVEEVLAALWDEADITISRPFVRLPYREAMEHYGIDKPDLRYELKIRDLTPGMDDSAAPFLREARDSGGRLRAILVPDGAGLSRKDLDGVTVLVKEAGAGGLVWARAAAGGWEGQGVKALGPSLLDTVDAAPGTMLLGVSGPDRITSPALHALRNAVIGRLALEPITEHAFCWVVDFPLFEPDP
ncbi:MAG: aspartate--tRNA ligase, partial [Micromonosporaceae bacterium]